MENPAASFVYEDLNPMTIELPSIYFSVSARKITVILTQNY
jgi:hypothetical protein